MAETAKDFKTERNLKMFLEFRKLRKQGIEKIKAGKMAATPYQLFSTQGIMYALMEGAIEYIQELEDGNTESERD